MGVDRGAMAVVQQYFAAAVALPAAAVTAVTALTLPAAAPHRNRLLPPQPSPFPAAPQPPSLPPVLLHATPRAAPHAPPLVLLAPPPLPRLLTHHASPFLLPHYPHVPSADYTPFSDRFLVPDDSGSARVDQSGRRSLLSFLGLAVFLYPLLMLFLSHQRGGR